MRYYIDYAGEGFILDNIEDVTAHLIELHEEDSWRASQMKVYELGPEVVFNIITKVEYGGPPR
jgi:hypothetical protein